MYFKSTEKSHNDSIYQKFDDSTRSLIKITQNKSKVGSSVLSFSWIYFRISSSPSASTAAPPFIESVTSNPFDDFVGGVVFPGLGAVLGFGAAVVPGLGAVTGFGEIGFGFGLEVGGGGFFFDFFGSNKSWSMFSSMLKEKISIPNCK